MKAYKNLKEVKKGCEEVNSCATGSDKFMYRCFPLLVEQLENINNNLRARRKREPSTYNLHIATELASGKTMQEAINSWRLPRGTKD